MNLDDLLRDAKILRIVADTNRLTRLLVARDPIGRR